MNDIARMALSAMIAFVAVVLVTAAVTGILRRAPAVATWKATRAGVLFVVCSRRWQRVLLRVVGIPAIVIGCFLLLVALTVTGDGPMLGVGIAGLAIGVGGILLLWLAHAMARSRLEVASGSVWVFPMAGAPRQVALGDITALASLPSSNFGGIVARAGSSTLFSANRSMLGYPQLIEWLRTGRPDLAVPDGSWPLQQADPRPR